METKIFLEDELNIQFSQTTDEKGKVNGIAADIHYDNDSLLGIISLESAMEMHENLTEIIKLLRK